ncbi:site-specific integrase [Acinetobacter baumannii]|uniref:Tyrosine recombinase XerC n=1 Tax=Acinetobacter baumannii (strain AB307-0294) TaxID=557600 RepID=A0A5K6CLL2_ACIB3|nr:site-specific integrase [Acinetobacter baumannii]ATY42702.1 Tyrosine recombinase XerC [Acinetobacter baumannii AB307-0294]
MVNFLEKNTQLNQFESGKEFDIRKYRPDLKVTGLRFVVTVQHVRTLARLTFQGKKISKSLGTFSHADFDQNLEKLISQMQRFHQRIAQGLAPFEDEVKPANTLREFALTIYMPSAEMRKKSYKDDEAKLRMHILPVIGDYPFEDINAGMLNKLLTELRSKGLTNASINRVRALLSVMFNMAINHDLIQVNPVSKVSKFKENNQIERYLNAQEIKRLMDVLNAPHQHGIDNLIIVAIVKFLLLTGVRKREAMDMKWTDVDLTTGVWLLGENKSGKARRITLNQDALAILHSLPQQHAFIFANPMTGQPFNDMRKTFQSIMKAASIRNIRIHDLRHNFASIAVNSGQSLYVVQHLLGHASPQTTQRYAHLQSSTLKQASEDVAAAIRAQSSHHNPTANVA